MYKLISSGFARSVIENPLADDWPAILFVDDQKKTRKVVNTGILDWFKRFLGVAGKIKKNIISLGEQGITYNNKLIRFSCVLEVDFKVGINRSNLDSDNKVLFSGDSVTLVNSRVKITYIDELSSKVNEKELVLCIDRCTNGPSQYIFRRLKERITEVVSKTRVVKTEFGETLIIERVGSLRKPLQNP